MRKIKKRKPRSKKLSGYLSKDMCPCCYNFDCNPFSSMSIAARKIEKRRSQGLCPSCGKKICRCKSKMDILEPKWISHNNKKHK